MPKRHRRPTLPDLPVIAHYHGTAQLYEADIRTQGLRPLRTSRTVHLTRERDEALAYARYWAEGLHAAQVTMSPVGILVTIRIRDPAALKWIADSGDAHPACIGTIPPSWITSIEHVDFPGLDEYARADALVMFLAILACKHDPYGPGTFPGLEEKVRASLRSMPEGIALAASLTLSMPTFGEVMSGRPHCSSLSFGEVRDRVADILKEMRGDADGRGGNRPAYTMQELLGVCNYLERWIAARTRPGQSVVPNGGGTLAGVRSARVLYEETKRLRRAIHLAFEPRKRPAAAPHGKFPRRPGRWQDGPQQLSDDASPHLPTYRVHWTLLPHGTWTFAEVEQFFQDLAKECPGRKYDLSRLSRIAELNPAHCYLGREGFRGYVAFSFEGSNAVVLENPMEGNAVYVIWDDWEELSRLTRQELLDKHRADVTRIVHSRAWFGVLQEQVRISHRVYLALLEDNP